jgi:hypothetical protein
VVDRAATSELPSGWPPGKWGAGMTAPKPRIVGVNAPERGRLPDGTPYFAPLGELPYDPDEDEIQSHLCGDWFRLVGASHVRRRG